MKTRFHWIQIGPCFAAVLAGITLGQGGLATAGEVAYGGKVVNEQQKPVAGAKVALIGSALSARTDASGAFTLAGAVPANPQRQRTPNFLEFTAAGCFAQTLVPDSTEKKNIVVVLDATASPAEDRTVDIARFAYAYRKGASNNPWETQWLPPYPASSSNDTLLSGFLWEELRRVDRVEVEFPAAGGATPELKDLKVIGNKSHWWNSQNWEILACTNPPTVTGQEGKLFTFRGDGAPLAKVNVLYNGGNPSVGAPVVRVYGNERWSQPQAVEIEWGFDRPSQPIAGRIEAYNGRVGKVEPLEKDNGIAVLGEHHWREEAASTGRRGIRVTLFSNQYGKGNPSGSLESMCNVTLWTSSGVVTFAPADLARGPILIPSVGVFIAPAGSGVAARPFQERLAAEKKKTLRQRVREHAEQSWAGAVGAFFQLDKLPAFPVPPEASPMQIEVPEQELVAQWKLGAWHLKRHTKKLNDRMYGVSIWPGTTYLAQESWQIIRSLDLLGVHDVAEGGLNYWIFAEAHGSNPRFSDNNGYLVRADDYDIRHTLGHGDILETAASHYQLTRNRAWWQEALPVLKKACEWTLRQRHFWNNQVPKESGFHGLLPPLSTGDFSTEGRVLFISSLTYYAGLKAVAELLARNGVDGAAAMLQEAERWRQDLRAAGDRSAALARVVQVGDGTYRRFMPFLPYFRAPGWDFNAGIAGDYHEDNFGSLRFVKEGIYGLNEPLAQEMLDVIEERLAKLNVFTATNPIPPTVGPIVAKITLAEAWFNTGANGAHAPGQGGYELHTGLHLVADDVPLFLRAMYNQYAAELMPAHGYIFSECPYGAYAKDKTFEEAAFLERVRLMLVMEAGNSLWLARATPRTWLEQGRKIAVWNSPTYFGTLAYEIVSDADHGKILATLEMPSRNPPKSVRLRLRHPTAAPLKGVEVNGMAWNEFSPDKETIELKGLTGKVAVVANY